jgi:hypothetical protein
MEPDIDIELDCAARMTGAPVLLCKANRAVVELAIKDQAPQQTTNRSEVENERRASSIRIPQLIRKQALLLLFVHVDIFCAFGDYILIILSLFL